MKPIVPNGKVAPARESAPVLIGPNYAVEPGALLLGKLKVEVGLKQEAPEELENLVPVSVQAQKEIQKKIEEKFNKISKPLDLYVWAPRVTLEVTIQKIFGFVDLWMTGFCHLWIHVFRICGMLPLHLKGILALLVMNIFLL